MANFDDIHKRLKDGVITTATLEELREAIGQRRLGPNVLGTIREQLKQEGLEYFPAWVLDSNSAPRKTQTVRICKLDTASAVFKIVQAVQEPTEAGDEALRQLETGPTALALATSDKLERLRAAIEDAMSILKEDEE